MKQLKIALIIIKLVLTPLYIYFFKHKHSFYNITISYIGIITKLNNKITKCK